MGQIGKEIDMLTTLKDAPALPTGWSWLNDTKLGQTPRWWAIPPASDAADTWDALKLRVQVMRKPWGGSPPLWLRGDASALADLVAAGYATRDDSGWYIPTKIGLATLS